MFTSKVLTVWDWILFSFLCCVPIFNIIFIIKILVSREINPNLKNFVAAALILIAAMFVLVALPLMLYYSII